MKLWLHNLGLFVIVAHSAGPRAETEQGVRGNLCNFGVEKLLVWIISRVKVEIGLKQLDGLLVDLILFV